MQTLALTQYCFHSNLVRVLIRDGEPCFIASDVCSALAVGNHRDAVSRLDEDEKGVATIDTLGGAQRVLIVSEYGLYSLILTSRKPEAIAFKRWVTHEVLPSIRKTGSYEVESVTMRRQGWPVKFVEFCDENAIDIGEAVRAMRSQILAKREVFQGFSLS